MLFAISCGGTTASGQADAGEDAGLDVADAAVGDAGVYCEPDTFDAATNDAGLVKCGPGEICGQVFANPGRRLSARTNCVVGCGAAMSRTHACRALSCGSPLPICGSMVEFGPARLEARPEARWSQTLARR